MTQKIILKNVRLSFPSLWSPAVFNGESTKYESTFLLDKDEHADLIKDIQTIIKDLIATELKGAKVPADKIFLRDGSESGYAGYENCYSLKASSTKRPLVINRDKSPLTEADGVIYSGCMVNAIINPWVQNNSYGRRVNAQLQGVQFFADNEPFTSGPSVSVDEFDAFSDDSDPFA